MEQRKRRRLQNTPSGWEKRSLRHWDLIIWNVFPVRIIRTTTKRFQTAIAACAVQSATKRLRFLLTEIRRMATSLAVECKYHTNKSRASQRSLARTVIVPRAGDEAKVTNTEAKKPLCRIVSFQSWLGINFVPDMAEKEKNGKEGQKREFNNLQ